MIDMRKFLLVFLLAISFGFSKDIQIQILPLGFEDEDNK
jgi:hypothetical protein